MVQYIKEILFAIVAAIITVQLYRRWNKRNSLPPGPKALPFLGNVFQMDVKNPLGDFARWRKRFGDIFYINLVGQDFIIISSYKLIKELLVDAEDVFSDRAAFYVVKANLFRFQEEVVLGNSSPTWKLKKKVMITSLKMYGEELSRLEKITLDCVQGTLKTIENTEGKPFNPRETLHLMIDQILAVLVSGCPLSTEGAKSLIEFQEIVQTKIFTPRAIELDWFHWLKYFGHPVWEEARKVGDFTWKLYRSMLQKRKEVVDLTNPQCMIDGFLLHQVNEKKTTNNPILNDDSLISLIVDIFEAGAVTTLRSLLSFIAILANHLDVQSKVQAEIDGVIGKRNPSLKDRHGMHYTSACLLELLRYTSGVPLLLPRMAKKDAYFEGYLIPKGSQIWCNAWEMDHDPTYWEEPWTFKPERFLDQNGEMVTPDHPNRRRVLSFGGGRRICPGEVFAKNRIFLIVACLLQKFTFLPSTEEKFQPNSDPRSYRFGTALLINDYNVIAHERT